MTRRIRIVASIYARALAILLLAFVALNVPTSGCRGTDTPKAAAARAAILLVAKAVFSADVACALWGDAERRRAAAEPDELRRLAILGRARVVVAECSARAHEAGPYLEAGEAALDASDATADGRIGCAAEAGLRALGDLVTILRGLKVAIPPIVDQAEELGRPLVRLAGKCSPPPAASVDAAAVEGE